MDWVCRSIVIDQIPTSYGKDKLTLVYIYFDYKKKTHSAENVIANILRQILSQRPQLPQAVVQAFKKSHNDTKYSRLSLKNGRCHAFIVSQRCWSSSMLLWGSHSPSSDSHLLSQIKRRWWKSSPSESVRFLGKIDSNYWNWSTKFWYLRSCKGSGSPLL